MLQFFGRVKKSSIYLILVSYLTFCLPFYQHRQLPGYLLANNSCSFSAASIAAVAVVLFRPAYRTIIRVHSGERKSASADWIGDTTEAAELAGYKEEKGSPIDGVVAS